MSGFAAFVSWDGERRAAPAIDRMLRAMARRGADDAKARCDGGVGLGFAAEADDVWVSFAGRLDEPESLRRELEALGRRPRDASDASLVAAAWEEWREECASHLAGDFALVVWDPAARVFFGARDIVGVRPFYYHAGARFFAAASEIASVLAVDGVSSAPNEEMIGEYLCVHADAPDETLYRSIARLPPAHCVRVEDGRAKTWRYWSPRVAPDPRLRGGDADAEVRRTLELSVRARLNGAARIAIDVSGGLDSSSVAATAARVRSPTGPELATASLVFPGRACDESVHIARVEAATRLPAHRVSYVPTPRETVVDRARRYRDFPGHPNGLMADALRAHLRDHGFAAELTGIGSDEWWSGAPDEALALDRARSGAWGRAIRLVGARSLLRALAREALPNGVREARRRRSARAHVPPWVAPDLAARVVARLDRGPRFPELPTRSQRAIAESALLPWTAHAHEMEEREATTFGIERRHPYCDRRMIALALAITAEEDAGDSAKPALRRALRGVLPEEVRLRRDKPTFDLILLDALEGVGESALRATKLASAGWIDESVALRTYREAIRDARGQSSAQGSIELRTAAKLWQLWMIVGLDFWLKLMV